MAPIPVVNDMRHLAAGAINTWSQVWFQNRNLTVWFRLLYRPKGACLVLGESPDRKTAIPLVLLVLIPNRSCKRHVASSLAKIVDLEQHDSL